VLPPAVEVVMNALCGLWIVLLTAPPRESRSLERPGGDVVVVVVVEVVARGTTAAKNASAASTREGVALIHNL